MLADFLTLRGVTVTKNIHTPDGQGGFTTTSSISTLPRAVIWSQGQSSSFISDKMAKISTHILVTIPSDYAFTNADEEVAYNGVTYKITGPSDNVMNKNEIMVTPLDLKV
jgi:hypothetical protein